MTSETTNFWAPRGEVSLRLPRSRDTSAERPRGKGRSRPTDSLTAARDGETVGNLGRNAPE